MSTQLEHGSNGACAGDLTSFLDDIKSELLDGPSVSAAMERLRLGLFECRQLAGADWLACCHVILRHPLIQSIHQDPLTLRSFAKPRGYPGDASLLDLIYYDQGFGYGEPTALGEAILRATRDAPTPRAVRERRDHMATLIDRVALRVPDASVLVLAAGHLREGLKSSAMMAGALGSLVAVDHDSMSLDVVSRAFGPRVTCINSSIRYLLTHAVAGVSTERFDLIYAAGLLDFLGNGVAARLLQVSAGLLKHGGELVVANLAPNIHDAGYIESYMAWQPLYRDRVAMLTLAAGVAAAGVEARCYSLSSEEIIYLQLSNGVP